jgi:hypothetical protein
MSWKGISLGVIFFISGLIYSIIPTYLIVVSWQWLNSINLNGQPLYTLSLFILFLWIVSLLIAVIYFVASVRAVYQRKSDDLGIPKGVSVIGIISVAFIIVFMILWYLLFQEIAFFQWAKYVSV